MKTTTTNMMMTDDEDRTRHNISQGMNWIEDDAPPRLDDDHSMTMKDP